MLVKTDIPGLMKDMSSGAVLNTDNTKLEAYKKTKQMIKDRQADKERLAKLESDLADIKDMLSEILSHRTREA